MPWIQSARRFSASVRHGNPFGIVLDIDGVLLRGRELLPRVKEAFSLITDKHNTFTVPTVFLTNGTNSLRAAKAASISKYLGFEIPAQQVVMAHSPLRMFTDLRDKQVLVVGQGPVKEIAKGLGFEHARTLQDLADDFPFLDCVDFSRRRMDPAQFPRPGFKPIEAVLCLGEPLRWEMALQLLVDVLVSNGDPGGVSYRSRAAPNYPHIPLIACNVDMVWMAEKGTHMPRFGHGCFLTCLESLYYKMTKRELHYKAVLGKPAEISYLHAAHVLQKAALKDGRPPPQTIYVIGDNPNSDILGARLFDRFLRHGGYGRFDHVDLDTLEDAGPPEEKSRHVVNRCLSVLVETGVYKEGCTMNGTVTGVSKLVEELSPREQSGLTQPDFVESDLYAAIQMLLGRERHRV